MECWRFIIWRRLCEKIRLTANVFLLQPLPAHGGWPLSVSTSLAQIRSLYPRGPFSGSRQATLAKTELLQALHIQPISFTKKPSLKRSSCFFVVLICLNQAPGLSIISSAFQPSEPTFWTRRIRTPTRSELSKKSPLGKILLESDSWLFQYAWSDLEWPRCSEETPRALDVAAPVADHFKLVKKVLARIFC